MSQRSRLEKHLFYDSKPLSKTLFPNIAPCCRLFFTNHSPEALLTCKTHGFPARKPSTQRFCYLFKRKTQPNHGFDVAAAATPRILRLRSASGERFLETVAPCSSLVPASPRSSLLRSSLASPLLSRLAPPSSLLLAPSPRSLLLALLPQEAPRSPQEATNRTPEGHKPTSLLAD